MGFLNFLFTLLLLCICACVPSRPGQTEAGEGLSDAQAAERALITFFDFLRSGNYPAAADLYAGPFETMIAHNPGIDPEDHPALLQAACELNGAQCLAPFDIRLIEDSSLQEGVYLFTVSFKEPDGSLFTLGACCGGDGDQAPAQTDFEFRVRKEAEYYFRVLDSPIYAP
ncbi:MAG: hypothetical protein PVF85_03080 [Anaerolineales bacterium]